VGVLEVPMDLPEAILSLKGKAIMNYVRRFRAKKHTGKPPTLFLKEVGVEDLFREKIVS
jgi:hypothetical protein